jgi:hypothetical protein
MTETLGIVSSNSTTIHALPDMQAVLRPSSWYHAIIGGHRCCKGNPNSLREQLSLKTNQGESKENTLRNPD